jgi:apolipoprotein N-acyltransferase
MIERYLKSRFLTIYFIPFIIGSLTILSFEPFNLTFINLIIFPIFFFLIVFINKKTKTIYRKKPYKKNLFIYGLAFGFGFYLSGISWITNSLTFDENFKILIPFALLFIPLFLSLFVGLLTLFVGPYLKLDLPSLLLFSASFSFSDYLRAHVLTGFPWNLWAYSTVSFNELLQLTNQIGLYSYNLFVITIFTFPIIIFFKITKTKKILSIISIFFIILSIYIYGNYENNKNEMTLENLE